MLATWKRLRFETWKRHRTGIYEATSTEGNKYFISGGPDGWSVYNNNEGRGICGEYLFWAKTLAEVKASI